MGAICQKCWENLLREGRCHRERPACPRCGRLFPSEVALAWSPKHFCGPCRRRPPRFDRAVTLGVYEGGLREVIHLFKYRRKVSLGERLIGELLRDLPPPPGIDGVLPVPLHPRRLREREFNPSLILARVVAVSWNLPLFPDLLVRTRSTPPQTGLRRKARASNVRGAIVLRSASPGLQGKGFLLVDDVLTTGATAGECARILKREGAERVHLLALATQQLGSTGKEEASRRGTSEERIGSLRTK
ncbi:MAG: ComF family protein [Nitrospirae bacterium]|nr:ComF family protein [Nitrospirota bacterium]